MSELNIELAEQVLEQITEHPETHCQEVWGSKAPGCGTQYCVAGWAAALNARFQDRLLWLDDGHLEYVNTCDDDGRDKVVSIPVYARRALGLSRKQANRLFYGDESGNGFGGSNEDAVKYLRKLIKKAKRKQGVDV